MIQYYNMRLSNDQKNDIVKMNNEKEPFSEIIKKYKISRATYYRIIKENKEKSIIQSNDTVNDNNENETNNDDNEIEKDDNDDNADNDYNDNLNEFDKNDFKRQLNTTTESDDEKEEEQVIETLPPIETRQFKKAIETENDTNNNISFISKTSRVSFGRKQKEIIIYQQLIKAPYQIP